MKKLEKNYPQISKYIEENFERLEEQFPEEFEKLKNGIREPIIEKIFNYLEIECLFDEDNLNQKYHEAEKLEEKQNIEEAGMLFDTLFEQAPENSIFWARLFGFYGRHKLHEIPELIQKFESIQEQNPNNTDALLMLCKLTANLKEFPEPECQKIYQEKFPLYAQKVLELLGDTTKNRKLIQTFSGENFEEMHQEKHNGKTDPNWYNKNQAPLDFQIQEKTEDDFQTNNIEFLNSFSEKIYYSENQKNGRPKEYKYHEKEKNKPEDWPLNN